MGVIQTNLAIHQKNRNSDDNSREHSLAQNEKQQIIFTGDVEAAEGIGRQHSKPY
jgi:hypothetical protein